MNCGRWIRTIEAFASDYETDLITNFRHSAVGREGVEPTFSTDYLYREYQSRGLSTNLIFKNENTLML